MTTHGEAPNKKRKLSDSNGLGVTGFWLAFAGAPSAPMMLYFATLEGWQGFIFSFVVLVVLSLAVPLTIAGFVLGVVSMQQEKRQNYGRAAVLLSFLTLAVVVSVSSTIYV